MMRRRVECDVSKVVEEFGKHNFSELGMSAMR